MVLILEGGPEEGWICEILSVRLEGLGEQAEEQ